MRTELTSEIDELLAFYLEHHKRCLPTKEFPHVFMLLASIKDLEGNKGEKVKSEPLA